MAEKNKTMDQWVIYDHPIDYPDGFIARRHAIFPGMHYATTDTVVGKTVDEVRAQLPRGLACFPRSETDDFNIVETWL